MLIVVLIQANDRDVLQQMLLDPRSLQRPYADGKVLESMVRQHVKGEANYTTEIHRLLTLELQHRLFLDS